MNNAELNTNTGGRRNTNEEDSRKIIASTLDIDIHFGGCSVEDAKLITRFFHAMIHKATKK